MTFFAALKFLTILPVFKNRVDTAAEIRGSVVYYPVVGFIIGLVLVGLNWLFRLVLPPAVASGLLVVSLAFITGALHLDGFADTCDGLAGHKPVEARWQVMHDSRTGAFGVVGLVLLLLMKYVSLDSLPPALLNGALLLAPLLGRWAMVFAIFAYPYARPEGLGRTIRQGVGWGQFTAATLVTLALAVLAAWWAGCRYFYLSGPGIMLAVWVIIMLAARVFRRLFAGLTGDTYGAINEIAELGTLVIINALAPFIGSGG